MTNNVVQVNFKMPPELKKELTIKAKQRGLTRSKYMRHLIMKDQKSA